MSHNFVDIQSDLCVCIEEAETITYFFCRCSLFSEQRIVLVDTVSEILARKNLFLNTLDIKDLVKIYLYGSCKFTVSENRYIFIATIKFITDSNRFSPQRSGGFQNGPQAYKWIRSFGTTYARGM